MTEQVWVNTGPTAHYSTITNAVHDPYTQQVIPEGTASPVDWIKATVRSVYPGKRDCPTLPKNVKWNTLDERANMLHIQTMWDRDIHLLNKPVTQVMVNTVVKGTLFTVPYVILLLQN